MGYLHDFAEELRGKLEDLGLDADTPEVKAYIKWVTDEQLKGFKNGLKAQPRSAHNGKRKQEAVAAE